MAKLGGNGVSLLCHSADGPRRCGDAAQGTQEQDATERAVGLLRGKGQIRPGRGWGFLAGLGKKAEEKQSRSSLAGGGSAPSCSACPGQSSRRQLSQLNQFSLSCHGLGLRDPPRGQTRAGL